MSRWPKISPARYFDPATFELDSVYYWQVIATNAAGARQAGPVWSFHTEAPFRTAPHRLAGDDPHRLTGDNPRRRVSNGV